MAMRSKYLGVYNVSADKVKDNKTFRVAIRKKNYSTGNYDWFNVPEHFQSEVSAARVYNAYAISFFGAGAVLNDVDDSCDTGTEVLDYFQAKENRIATMRKIAVKKQEILASGKTFKLHTQLPHAQEQATAPV